MAHNSKFLTSGVFILLWPPQRVVEQSTDDSSNGKEGGLENDDVSFHGDRNNGFLEREHSHRCRNTGEDDEVLHGR